jgi:hypothetical protein
MAEAAGLVLGAAALAGVFKDCIDLFSYITAACTMNKDYELLETRLDVEKTLLLHWAERVRLVKRPHDKRLDNHRTQKSVARVLAGIQSLLSESKQLQQRYGLMPTPTSAGEEMPLPLTWTENSTSSFVALGNHRTNTFMQDFRQLTLHSKAHGKSISTAKKVRWAIRDKDEFEKLLQTLSDFVQKLNALVPAHGPAVLDMVKEDLEFLTDSTKLKILEAASGRQSVVANSAAELLEESCAQRILDLLWFRKMDDRRKDVASPYPETLHWALEPSHAHGKWDDLTEWLRSGSGIYWLSGKAGSGKSTLMKYLFFHSRAKVLLERWAGDDPLCTASFFFWSLGSDEQKSQEGLARALLYKVLDSDHSLIPLLFPEMWREAYGADKAKVSLPTPAELKGVLSQLAHLPQDHPWKYCFFIDGLDEYSGHYADGVSLVNTLSSNPNIKIIVSSRPISACVQAFSSRPKLHLQDLTKNDIQRYVHGVVGSHPYLTELLEIDPHGGAWILTDLVEKASGVFLWVILACRSVLEGFAAFDRVSELRARVDELPIELEDLFRHMLGKIEPRYQAHASRLLRICYTNHRHEDVEPLKTLGLALLDEHDMDISLIPRPHVMSLKEKVAKCRLLEGRLRSRSWGLLEVKRVETDHSSRCLCGSQEEHDPIADSTVEFLHRTVFEFLDGPSVWQLDCLSTSDEGFEPYSVLSFLSIHLAELGFTWGDCSADTFLHEMLLYAVYADRSATATNKVGLILRRFEEIIADFPLTIIEALPSIRPVMGYLNGGASDNLAHFGLLLAIETGMVNFVRLHLENEDETARSKHSLFPLLDHALSRRFGEVMPHSRLHPSILMVKLLLSLGSDPNETFIDIDGLLTTPW